MYEIDFCSLSWKLRWIAIAPKPFSALSILSCAFVIKDIVTDRKRRSSLYHRIILSMSTLFLFGSIATFIGTWAVPAGSLGVCLAAGNDISCSVQGFCIQMFGVGSTLNYASLSIYYYLVINHGWSEKKLKRVGKWLLAFPLVFSLSTATAGAALDLYHNANLWCFIAPDKNKDAYRTALFYGPIWAALLLATFLMILNVRKVLQTERATDKYVFRATDGSRVPKRRKNTKMIAHQAVAYVLAFYSVALFPSIVRVSEMVKGSADFGWVALFTIFQPSQGIATLLIYFRPRYLRYRKRNPDRNFFSLLTSLSSALLTRDSSRSSDIRSTSREVNKQRSKT